MQVPLFYPAQEVTLHVPDAWSDHLVSQAQRDVGDWLGTALMTLDRAMDYSAHAYRPGVTLTPKFRFLLHTYFRMPRNPRQSDWVAVVNEIVAKLNQTRVGLTMPFILRDLTLLSGWPNFCMTCLGKINRRRWHEVKMAGLVYESVGEVKRRKEYEKKFGRGTLATVRPKGEPIYLNFEYVWRVAREAKMREYPVRALIHEATHKFAITRDVGYLPYDTKVAEKTFVNADAFTRMGVTLSDEQFFKPIKLGAEDTALMTALAKHDTKTLLENADSLAWYATDVAALGSGTAVAT